MSTLTCFNAIDIRGEIGKNLDDDIAERIGKAFATYLKPASVVIGGDNRLSTPAIKAAVIKGLQDQGVNVINIGLCGTEEIYFATEFLGVDGGIMITASHNPVSFNGMKMVSSGAKPVSQTSGLKDIQRLAEQNAFNSAKTPGKLNSLSVIDDYINKLMSFPSHISFRQARPVKLVVNAGNGAAGHVIDALEKRFKSSQIPISFIKINHEPDGTFPHGVPNPLLPENREITAKAVIKHKADLGVAWDGDFDRCFLFDETGAFIEGYYIVGLLAEFFLTRHPGETIIHDPRLWWNTQFIADAAGGMSVQCRTGHTWIKQSMRDYNAVYGGEMSAHHYFRDFYYCDSGMIPWMLVLELMLDTEHPLSKLVNKRMAQFPASGEINRKVANPEKLLASIKHFFLKKDDFLVLDETDGLSLSFSNWRFNLRKSNTEPLVRLNVESRDDKALMKEKTHMLLTMIDRAGAA